MHNRRKAFIYVSNGYDFDPFSKSRAKERPARCSEMTGRHADSSRRDSSGEQQHVEQRSDDATRSAKQGNEFADADLAPELSELTRAGQPRQRHDLHHRPARPGRRSGPRPDKLDMMDWQDHIRETQNSLRVLAELTGGFAVVNQNDFDKALKRIDAETSDYYVLGYYSTNPDPLKKRRSIEVRVRSDGGKYALELQAVYT